MKDKIAKEHLTELVSFLPNEVIKNGYEFNLELDRKDDSCMIAFEGNSIYFHYLFSPGLNYIYKPLAKSKDNTIKSEDIYLNKNLEKIYIKNYLIPIVEKELQNHDYSELKKVLYVLKDHSIVD